jgi:hypothetical protein
MASVILLLPARSRLGGEWPPALSRMLGRATRLPPGEAGERAQLLRHFDLLPRGWPVAALTRQADVGDAAGVGWVRADPAWVRPEMTGARLFACGEGVGVTQADVDALLPALQPVFGDAGFALDAPDPSRWYLTVPRDAPLPVFVDPSEALGTDVFDHLPGNAEGGTSRRWRDLLNDAQIVLHNHPRNAQRAAAGLPPINSLWFWGGGTLPARVSGAAGDVRSDDATLRSLAAAAAVASVQPLAGPWVPPTLPTLVDLRSARSTRELAADWILPVTRTLVEGKVDSILLDFEDGARLILKRHHRWRFWRGPLHGHHAKAQAPHPGMEPPE